MKKVFLSFILFGFIASATAQSPKYIFYFIGDGMGFSHLQMTQGALAAKDDKIGFAPLSFTSFPAKGMASTNAATRLTTCSAAAGTALATGTKTSIGTIGMNIDHTANLTSIAIKAKEAGKKVGVVTTVSIDHATPAAFYAHVPSRSNYKEIAEWLPKSNFDLLAGSGLLNISANYYDSIAKHCGYNVVRGKNATLSGTKNVWIEREGAKVDNLSLAIDRDDEDMSLPLIIDRAIHFLDNGKNGFFLMAEGGQIDWAAHSNDAASITAEVIDFSNAIAKAIEFYNQHPNETLIVITADHETGGLALGRKDRDYDTDLEKLFDQEGSKGVVGDDVVKQINHDAGVAFTTGSHTAAFVPVYAIGVGSEEFNGTMDNTDIPNRLLKMIEKR